MIYIEAGKWRHKEPLSQKTGFLNEFGEQLESDFGSAGKEESGDRLEECNPGAFFGLSSLVGRSNPESGSGHRDSINALLGAENSSTTRKYWKLSIHSRIEKPQVWTKA